MAPGANAAVTADDALGARALLRGARFLVMQCEVPIPAVRAAAALAADLRNVYVGSLMGDRIPWFRSPVPGRR